MFNKSIQTALLGLVFLVCLYFGMGQSPIIATTLTESPPMSVFKVQPVPEVMPNVGLGLDQFLTSLPRGYYTIGSVAELKSLIATSQPLLVDVREPTEYRSGHIPGAINIPLQTLTVNLDKIPHNRPVVLYCSTGYRSAMGVMSLHLLGYDNVQGFPPSFSGWSSSGEAIINSSEI